MIRKIILVAFAFAATTASNQSYGAYDPQAKARSKAAKARQIQAAKELKEQRAQLHEREMEQRSSSSSSNLDIPHLKEAPQPTNHNGNIGIGERKSLKINLPTAPQPERLESSQNTQRAIGGKWVSDIVVPLQKKTTTRAPNNSQNQIAVTPYNQSEVQLPGNPSLGEQANEGPSIMNSYSGRPPRSHSEPQESLSIQKADLKKVLAAVKADNRRMVLVEKLKNDFIKRLVQPPTKTVAKAAQIVNKKPEDFMRDLFNDEYDTMIKKHTDLLKENELGEKIPSKDDLWNTIKAEARKKQLTHDCYTCCGKCSIQ